MNILQKATTRRRSVNSLLWDYQRSLDWLLLGATLGLVVYGFLMIYSATYNDPTVDSPFYYVRSQSVGLALGLVLLIVLSAIDYRSLARFQPYIYAGCIILLVLTLLVGSGGAEVGARRWLEYKSFRLQTSELVKFLLIVALGAVLAEGVELRGRFRFVLLCVLYMLVPGVLVFLQPDLGTSLVFVAILFAMLVVWGIRLTHLGALLGMGAGAAALLLRVLPSVFGVQLLRDWQLQRLTVFLDPEKDPQGAGYQLIQSKIAIGSGMFSGKGYLQGTQHNLAFLPERHTDFIFAVIGEELGFLGAVLLLGLFVVVVWRAFRIARLSGDLYGRLIAAGVAGVIVFQVFVNVGMTIGIMPITGLPLPFVSFGSSSLVVFLMAIGLLESVHVHSVAGATR